MTPTPQPYPAYKPSGVEWLGEIPAHWEARRLKYSAPIHVGKLDRKPQEATYVGLEHIESWTGRLLLNSQPEGVDSVVGSFGAGDVLFGKLRPYLAKSARPDFDGVATSELIALRPLSDCTQSYVMYCLLNEAYIRWIDVFTYGARMPRVSPDQVAISSMPLPSLAEQRAIAAYLDRETAKIDALVAKKERLIKLLQEKRTALISRAVTKGLDPNVPMKDSGVEWLGEIPAHWEVKRLKHALSSRKGALKTGPFGSQLKSTEMLAGEIKVYNQRSVINRDFTIGQNYISLEKFSELRVFEVFPNDLLVTTRGTIGMCAVVPLDSERGILHPCLMRMQFDSSIIHNHFAEYVIQDSGYVMDQLDLKSNATTIDVIYSESLSKVWLAVPPVADQRAITAFLGCETAKIDILIGKVREAIERVNELRTALIAAAVTGRIDVREEAA